MTLVALLLGGGIFLAVPRLRAWLKSGSGNAASTASRDGQRRAGDITNLLSPPPSAAPAAEASPIVPRALNDNPTSTENSATNRGARLSPPSLAESVGKQMQLSSTKREASNPKPSTAIGKPGAMEKPAALAPTPSVLSNVPDSENPINAPSTSPVNPVASTTARDYGI